MNDRLSDIAQADTGVAAREIRRDPSATGSRSYWLDRAQNVSKIYYALWAVGAVLVLADFVVHRHDELGFAETAGFYAAYGFVACVALVLTAKGLRRLLKRPEDYYER
jgi:hypothetical protein